MKIELITQLIEAAKKDKKALIFLKNAAVRSQLFELAANIRELENELFPDTDEQKSAKVKAKEINLLFRMVELNVSEDVCWLISETLKVHSKMKGKFSIREASQLIVKRKELFED